MKIIDCIYGDFKVEGILKDIIETKEVQRLKEVHQGGASYLVNDDWNVTRYEHSVGVMLLIRMMGGSIEEQIAGLLHDISHTAFSHVVDFALKNSDEDYHEKIYDEIIEKSKIPEILSKQGYDYKDILFNESKWTILERSLPKLCADRVDYTLRDMYAYGNISKEEIKVFLNNIKLVNGEIVITSVEIAEWFVEIYYKEVIDFFMNPLNLYANNRLAEAIKVALNINEITLDDLLRDDKYVYGLLQNSKSEEVLNLIKAINREVKLVEDEEAYDIFQKNKLRLIDPSVVINNEIFNISSKSKKAQELTERAFKKAEKGIYLRIIR